MSKTYKLYAGAEQNVKCKFSFIGTTSPLMFIYSDVKPKGKFTLIPTDKEKNIPDETKKWLIQCKKTVNVMHIKNNQKAVMDIMNEFLDQYEKELSKIQQ